jgi:TatD DNase family protein
MNPLNFTDTHVHLDEYVKNNELPSILERAKAFKVHRMITIGTNREDWDLYKNLSINHPSQIHYTVGLHPSYVDEAWEQDMELLKNFLTPPYPLGFGEIGLDAFHLPEDPDLAQKTLERQRLAFETQLELVKPLTCPIVIHSRQCFKETLHFIDKSGIDPQRFVFHCFVEGPDEAHQLIERGISASFTGIITYKNAQKVRDALLTFGPDRFMLETDCPFLTPVPHRGERNEPAYTWHVAEAAAALFGLPIEAISEKTEAHVQRFWGI